MVGGAEGAFVRLSGVCSCAALTLGDLRDLLCVGLLGSVPWCCGAGFFCNYGSGFWGNLTPSACAVDMVTGAWPHGGVAGKGRAKKKCTRQQITVHRHTLEVRLPQKPDQ